MHIFQLVGISFYSKLFVSLIQKLFFCTTTERDNLLIKLKALADCYEEDKLVEKMNDVKSTSAFQHKSVQNYLNKWWFPSKRRWIKAYRDKRYDSGNYRFL